MCDPRTLVSSIRASNSFASATAFACTARLSRLNAHGTDCVVPNWHSSSPRRVPVGDHTRTGSVCSDDTDSTDGGSKHILTERTGPSCACHRTHFTLKPRRTAVAMARAAAEPEVGSSADPDHVSVKVSYAGGHLPSDAGVPSASRAVNVHATTSPLSDLPSARIFTVCISTDAV